MIEIIEIKTTMDDDSRPVSRAVEIIISSGGLSFLWSVGGLPLVGDLQTILDAREAELFAVAQAEGRVVDLYEITSKRILKAFALVVMDEINILRNRAGLPLRTAGQIDDAIKARLKAL